MTGGQKAAAIIALVVIAMVAFNWSLWRRLKAAQAERAGWSAADFDAQLVANGVSAQVAVLVRELVSAPFYGAGIAPHPDDDFARFLAVDETEVADIAATGCEELGADRPEPTDVPPIRDLSDLAEYLQSVADARRTA
ncbi:hypothetical protein [Sphingomonas sp. Leaf4]|uniref:hypothetical protein n=1 Tax=Sphingomonas sp. Leaf4 TaxID=2876553 RepID=UPI001E34EABC|nr:hypothetical protein [Sphingomonas sp. Leaf4]